MKVAVIGAGPSGLVSARELIREGAEVVVFEENDAPGGVWIYEDDVEDDVLGVNPTSRIRCSLYESLRTNLPRDLMAFLDYTFDSNGGGEDDWPRYPHHSLVLKYLENFVTDFELNGVIRFLESVTDVTRNSQWQVTTSLNNTMEFDAILVCNGHYTKPRIPQLKGIEHFKGEVLHSHNYRRPDAFTGKRVALWGTAASGFDISFEIASVADAVYWCGNAFTESFPMGEKVVGHPSPDAFNESGELIIGDTRLSIDSFMYCTGYEYEFPFLGSGVVSIDDNWIAPLYRDIIPVNDPTIGFIGLPYLVVPFPLFEMQAKWFAKQLMGSFSLPDESDRRQVVEKIATEYRESGSLNRHFHRLGDEQENYYNLLATECGEPRLPEWWHQTLLESQEVRMANPATFRDMPLPVRGPTVVSG